MIISFSASVTGINTLLSKKFAWKISDLSTENLLDPVLNYTEQSSWSVAKDATQGEEVLAAFSDLNSYVCRNPEPKVLG